MVNQNIRKRRPFLRCRLKAVLLEHLVSTRTKYLILTLLLSLLPVQSWGAVTFDAASQLAAESITGVAHVHTVAGSNTYLACIIAAYNSTEIEISAHYNSARMRRKTIAKMDRRWWMELWEMVGPPIGKNKFEVKLSELANLTVGCTSFSGVNQKSPSGPAGAPTMGRKDRLSMTVRVPADGAAVSFGFTADMRSCHPIKPEQTLLFDYCEKESVRVFGSTTNVPGRNVMSWTFTGGETDAALTAFSLNPALTNISAPKPGSLPRR